MKPFDTLRGSAVPLTDGDALMANVDTDMIIPKQFLKTVSRTGLRTGLFYELKTLADGSPNPDFVLNKPQFASAEILIAGENFGCGSSREHAPWALLDQGLRCVIAPSFADIFFNNCFKNGILPIALPLEVCRKLAAQAGGGNAVFNRRSSKSNRSALLMVAEVFVRYRPWQKSESDRRSWMKSAKR